MKVLVVEDDLVLSDVIVFTLQRAGYAVVIAHDGEAALTAWQTETPDILILDLNLPKIDGFTVCQKIRAQGDTPIIILSVRDDEDDIVRGLRLGADDYIIKPFSPKQMIARIEALLRRAGTPVMPPGELSAGDLTLDRARRELYRCDRLLTRLTRLECRLLAVLMLNKGQVIPSNTLIDHVWGIEGGDRTTLKQLVYRIRRKIEPDPSTPVYLETVADIGYTLTPH